MATAVEIPNFTAGYYLRPNEVFVPVEEYLRTGYRPDMDYVDGHLEDRNVGEFDHSRLQQILCMMLGLHEDDWGILVCPDAASRSKRIAFVCRTC